MTIDATIVSPSAASLHWKRYALVLFAACLWTGAYCCELNQQYYRQHHPFYDSLSYNEKLFRVMTISRDSGFLESLETACFENNTNCLPFIVAAAVAPLAPTSRCVGVWIQTGLLVLFLMSLYYYLIWVRSLRPVTALAGCLAFLTAKCLFFFNGGLSDFRMDLSLYLSFSMTCVWLLTCLSQPARRHFVILGVAASICCLFRATAPVYLLFCLGPLALIELVRTSGRISLLRGLGWSTAVVLVLSGWFYVANFEFLRYYYLVWNTDANAKIPLSDAMHHWKLVQRSIGGPLVALILAWGLLTLMVTGRRAQLRGWIAEAWREREIDWRIGWLAIAPVVMLVARRAGLNPFVSMPAVFGLVLFFTLPAMKQMDRLNDRRLMRWVWAVLAVCLVAAFARGWQRHSRIEFETMAARHRIIDEILQDAKDRNDQQISFGVMHLTEMNANSLYSTLLFDREDATANLNSVVIDSVEIKRVAVFSRPAKADWDRVTGQTDSEKEAFLIARGNAAIDYLVLPDARTARELESTARHNYINRHLVTMREMIVSDERWVLLDSGIPTDEHETIQIYRRRKSP